MPESSSVRPSLCNRPPLPPPSNSDDNMLKNIELFDKLSLRFNGRVLFIKDVIGDEICCWSFYGQGRKIAEVCCTSIVYATEKKQTKVRRLSFLLLLLPQPRRRTAAPSPAERVRRGEGEGGRCPVVGEPPRCLFLGGNKGGEVKPQRRFLSFCLLQSGVGG